MSKGAFDIATYELGTAEIFGDTHNSRIVEYHAATSLRATSDEVPWCASFVNWCLKKATITGTNSARARSFLTWGVAVSLEEAERGDIVVLSRGTNVQFGHVGFFAGQEGKSVLVLGGNQSNKVSISPYPLHRILSIRRAIMPSETPSPTKFRIPSVFQWIAAAPTLIGKIQRIAATAQAKNWTTTAVALVALVAYVGNLFGLPIDDSTVRMLEAAAIAVIGFFTGKQVINPQKLDAAWKSLSSLAEDITHGQT
ncbi:MAG: TIGR02594 family protein [Ignavibacteria bacterium]|nr:TIGR02594 family protein [Ignavibacteria bacterium]